MGRPLHSRERAALPLIPVPATREDRGGYIDGRRHHRGMRHVLFLALNELSASRPAGHFSLTSCVVLRSVLEASRHDAGGLGGEAPL